MSDDDLKRRFHTLRETERSSAPPYRRPAPRPPAAASRWPGILAGAATAAIAAWLLLAPPGPAPELTVDWQPGSWAMPTDVLLELPGQELLTELPVFESPFLELEPAAQAPPAPHRTLRRTLG